jgi:hypothetical protein
MATETNKIKTVKIRLPRSRKENDDVYVAVNGKSYLIQRGVDVEVPDYVAKVIQDSEDMLFTSMAYENQAKENVD